MAWVLGATALVLVPIAGRTLVDGRAELANAELARASGDRDAEIRHLGRAARFRLPLASHDEQALDRLATLGRASQADPHAQEQALALAAWRELRGALLGTRTVDVSDPERLREANAAIVELMLVEARRDGRPSASERWAAELEEDTQPRGRSLLAALCLCGWVVASLGFFVRGIDAKGRLDPRPARRWGASVLILLVCWILLM